MNRKRPTMGDVARLSGVSQTTVSFVINNTPNANISEKTRAAVMKAVEQLGYTPNAIAVGLRTSQSRVIGLVTDEIATTAFAGNIVQGAQDAARKEQRLLMLMNSGQDTSVEDEEISTLLSRQVDGIIFATMRHRIIKPSELLYQTPAVLLNCHDVENTLPSVVPDEYLGGYQAAEALLQKNHRCIGMINTSEDVPASKLREEGFRQALADHGIAVEDELIVYGEDGNAKTGYDGTRTLFSRYDHMTGLFCFNDRVAMGAYDALRQMRKRIPEDVAVVGFDDYEIISANLHPQLTTMHLPLYEMGRWAVEALLKISLGAAGEELSSPKLLPCPLITRDST
ncbi:MAG: LacI family DNA-binding transcriptional regulator [Chloroflexi bacterium]|nr:LacI family DNA-binding transcriptional regulator [Chloroflexota bacterium]